MGNFWSKLPKPIICLAPMEGVTDSVFRQLIAGIGRPNIFFTEFTGVEQLFSPGWQAIIQNLEYTEVERPLVLQLWGITPELFEVATDLAVELGFDGVDLNMGCPDRSILKRGACSALIRDRELAHQIIEATKRGAAGRIPVSVKTRIGFNKPVTEDWCGFLLSHDLAALTIHGRTSKEKSLVPNNWEEIGKVVGVRDRLGVDTLIIGNGDIQSREEALDKAKVYNLDGIMIGRGIFHDPWIFNPSESFEQKSREEKLELLRKHVELYTEFWGNEKRFERLKRFFKIYVRGFEGAVELREKLMESKNLEEVLEVLISEALADKQIS